MAGKLRILHVAASHRWTGAAEPAARMAAAQVRAGHEVLFSLTAGHSFEREVRALGVPISDAVEFERSYWPHRKLRDLRALKKLIDDFKPQIVHAHLTHDHIVAGVAIGKRAPGKPALVRTFHREEPPRRDVLWRSLVIKRTAGCLVVSRSLAEQVMEAFDLPADRVAIIGSDVDTARFAPSARGAEMRRRWGIPADAFTIGLVSRLRSSRGIDWLLKAVEKFLPANQSARLVICGRGSYADSMVEAIAAHPAKNQIVYAGYVTGSDLEDAYNAFDVSLMLKPGNDGACRAALEAMACARPVIGGDMGAIRDLVGNGAQGWLVPVDDVDALAGAMMAAFENPQECRKRGHAGREKILAEGSEEAQSASVIRFYERVAAE